MTLYFLKPVFPSSVSFGAQIGMHKALPALFTEGRNSTIRRVCLSLGEMALSNGSMDSPRRICKLSQSRTAESSPGDLSISQRSAPRLFKRKPSFIPLQRILLVGDPERIHLNWDKSLYPGLLRN